MSGPGAPSGPGDPWGGPDVASWAPPRPRGALLAWSQADPDAPRPVAGRPFLASRVTRTGRFAKLDPAKPGEVWSWAKLGALVGWAGLTVGALVKAWRDTGGAGVGTGGPGEEGD